MVKKTPKTDTEEVRDKLVHVAFTASEKELYKKYAKESNESLSNFIRLALEEKIMRIDNPDKFGDITTSEERLREIEENQKKQFELNQLILERLNIINGINDTMDALKPLINQEEIKEVCDTIVSMLKVHVILPIDKLEVLTSYKKKIIYDCIAMNDKLKINDNGEVYLSE